MYILRIKRYNIMLCLHPLCFVQIKGGMLKKNSNKHWKELALFLLQKHSKK
jgi:hypothetical protein